MTVYHRDSRQDAGY